MTPATQVGVCQSQRASRSRARPSAVCHSGPTKVMQYNTASHNGTGGFSFFFFHPIGFCFLLHAQEMHRGAPPFLHVTPQGLHIVMMHPAAANAQPFPLTSPHQMQRRMRVLKMFIRLYRFQICAAKAQIRSPRADRNVICLRKRPAFHLALRNSRPVWGLRSSATPAHR